MPETLIAWDYVAQWLEGWVDFGDFATIESPAAPGEGLTAIRHQRSRVHSVVLGWLAALFAVMAAVVTMTAVVAGWPVLLLALPLAGVAGLFWYHATGRLTEKLREQARRGTTRRRRDARRRRAATAGGQGPRRTGRRRARQRRRAPWENDRRRSGPWGAGERRRRRPSPPTDTGMPRDRARGILGVDADADAEAVRAAYRRKVKEAHPDRGGSTEAFQRVTEAYETLDETAEEAA